jgi:sugar lactone lactonase YvrE
MLIRLAVVGLCFLSTMAHAGPTKLWSVTTGLKTPESAVFDAKTQRIYVSSIAGQAGEKDGNGWISVLKLDGSVEHERMVEGLHAPKGLGIHDQTLWVADIGEVVAIDLATRKISRRIAVGEPGSFLNDIAVAGDGTIYVSDMALSKIYAIRNGSATVALSGVDAVELPNGLAVAGDSLFVATWGKDMQPDFSTKVAGGLIAFELSGKQRKVLAANVGNLDGLVARKDGSWLMTDWKAGKLFSWRAGEAAPQELLGGLGGAADIGYVPSEDIVLIPEMNKDTLHAYKLGDDKRG